MSKCKEDGSGRSLSEMSKVINLVLISASNLFGGVSLSLLSPFYSAEALLKGVSVTKSGLVFGSVFVTTVLCTPVIGRYIEVLGARKFLLLGSAICALGNVAFGTLCLVQGSTAFFLLSVLVRVFTAVGESALPTAAMALASRQVSPANEGKAVAACETCFGVGSMLGPSIGGLLYDIGGFTLPFAVCGGAQCLVILLTCAFLKEEGDRYTSLEGEESMEVTWSDLLRAPGILITCFGLVLAGSNWTWCFASLQPFLAKTYGFSPATTGLFFMLFAATYTAFTPIFGWLMDRGVLDGFTALLLGNLGIGLALACLAPAPPLDLVLAPQPWLPGLCMALQGAATSATYIGSLICMLKSASRAKLPDNERVKGMVASLWVVADCLGGIIGSPLGSLTYDNWGMGISTGLETAGLLISVILLGIYSIGKNCKQKTEQTDQRQGVR